jgi:oligoribonuclease
MTTKRSASNLIWIDLEMTGLDPEHDKIIEIASVVTNKHLEVIAEGPVFAVHQSDAVLEKMDEWNVTQHGKSGLIERVKNSPVKLKEAEEETLAFLEYHVPAKKSPMCGNTICQDRRFLCRHMPKLEQHFHYRNLDVSTLKILVRYWYPKIIKEFKKDSRHVALADVYDSIAELKYYRECLFVPLHTL